MLATTDLVYYPDSEPGIRRLRRGTGFSFIAADGTRIDNTAERKRLMQLAVPPAYEQVWICPLQNGHLQATGLDARLRKQYKYHAAWSQAQSTTKFSTLVDFGLALPALRRRVARDLASEAGEQSFALAAATFLIDRLSLRIGTRDYAVQNGSYGALTLKRRHVQLADGHVTMNFVAKGGKRVRRRIADRKLMQILGKARDLPGAELLGWLDADGTRHSISSSGLNAYLADASGGDFTAKTFRTWAGTVAAFGAAAGAEPATIGQITAAAADRLHNTPAIAKSSYVHPAVLGLAGQAFAAQAADAIAGLSKVETGLLHFLQSQNITDLVEAGPPSRRSGHD